MAISNSDAFDLLPGRSGAAGVGAGPVAADDDAFPTRPMLPARRDSAGTHRSGGLLGMLFLAGCLLLNRPDLIAAAGTTPGSDPARRAYLETRERYLSDTNQIEAAWQFARACFDWGDFSENDSQRAQIAREGIAVSRQVVGMDPKLAAGHYYLAFNLGQLARTKLLGALGIVREMERELKSARELDENLDYAGPDRSLGQLYDQAPGWPTSIGDSAKAQEHLRRAVQLCGRYPDNRLLLMETWTDSGSRADLEREARSYAGMLEAMRGEFAGERWAASWVDWDRRWKVIQGRLEKHK